MMICLSRRKYLIFLTFASLSVFVIVVNRFLSTNLTDDNDDDDGPKDPQTTWREVFHEVVEDDDDSPTSKTTTTKTSKSAPTTSSKSRKIGFLKPQMLGTITTASNPFQSKIIDVNEIKIIYQKKSQEGGRYIPEHRVVHLDFKGAPPKLSYLKTIFPLLKDAGATALLLEYEDMFPFWGLLRNVSSKNAFTAHDVQTIQTLAAQNDLMVIPLIQTFGHLEFILKLDEFKHLREVPIYPQSICPTNDESWKLITQMIDQGESAFILRFPNF